MILAALSGLPSCASHRISVNDNTLYEPPALLTPDWITDPGLRNCVQQQIEDEKISAPDQLRELGCSYAGIVRLDGLERFPRLRQLALRANQLADIEPLFALANLELVDLRDNPQLPCEQIARLASLVVPASQFPSHCPETD